jgi:hypothetical protein
MSPFKWILLFTNLFFTKPSYGANYVKNNEVINHNQSINHKPQKVSIFQIMKLRKEFKKIKFKGKNAKSDFVGAAVCGFFAILFLVSGLQSDFLSRILLLLLAVIFGILALVFLLKAAVNNQMKTRLKIELSLGQKKTSKYDAFGFIKLKA